MAHFSIQKKRDHYRKQGIFHTNKDLAQKVKARLEQYTDQPITEIVDLCLERANAIITEALKDIGENGKTYK